MLQILTTNRFEKELKLAVRRGKDPQKIKLVMQKLACQELLEPKYRDHKLSGEFQDCRECHLEPDWFLIYRITEKLICFERTGSHSDLFE